MILLKGAEVYAPRKLGIKDVLICHDKIVEIGEELSPNIKGIKVIDLKGKKLLPGFIDQHVHIIGGGGEAGFHSRTPELNVSSAISAGVTTMVGLLGTDGFTRTMSALIAKAKALNNEGITCRCLTSYYGYPPVTFTDSVAKDIVFIEEIIGCKLAVGDHRASHPAREELIRIASDVRVAGLTSGKAGELHLHVGKDVSGIDMIIDIVKTTDIPISVFRPTHMAKFIDRAVEFMSLGGYVDFTARDTLAEKLSGIISVVDNKLITISSDSNGSMPRFNDKQELVGMGVGKMTTLYNSIKQMVVDFGQKLEDVLPFITSNVADALLFSQKGRIKVGLDADFVILDGEMNVETVIAKGVIAMENRAIFLKGMFE